MPPLRFPLLIFARSALGLLLIGHGLMIVAGPLSWDMSRLGRMGEIFYYYGEAAGTNSQYAFFSPGISIQIRARFLIKKDQGTSELIDFMNGRSRETDLRLGDISDQFLTLVKVQEPIRRKLQRSLAASMVANVFSRYPDARSIVLTLEEFEPKPLRAMEPYPPPRWRQVYTIEFSRHKKRGEAP
jgi:hypothetical protein